MKSNGETRAALQQCACAIDIIASLISYESYVAAETVASIQQDIGPVGRAFKATQLARDDLNVLERAEAEAEVRCF